MKLFVINLDRRPDRLQRMTETFAGLGLAFVRTRAVDGADLTEEAIARWCGKGAGPAMGRGTVGCFLSHRECWLRVVQEDLPFAAIFEDDLHVSADAASLLRNGDWVPDDVDLVKLETMRQPTRLEKAPLAVLGARALYRLAGRHVGAGGYVVTRRGAEKLIAMSETLDCPVDHLLFNPELPWANSLARCQLSPAICMQDFFLKDPGSVVGLGSDIHEERSWRKPRGVAKLLHELKRPFIQIGGLVQRKVSSAITNKRWVVVGFR